MEYLEWAGKIYRDVAVGHPWRAVVFYGGTWVVMGVVFLVLSMVSYKDILRKEAAATTQSQPSVDNSVHSSGTRSPAVGTINGTINIDNEVVRPHHEKPVVRHHTSH